MTVQCGWFLDCLHGKQARIRSLLAEGPRESSAEVPGGRTDGEGGAGAQGRRLRVDRRPDRSRPRVPHGDQEEDPPGPRPHHPGERKTVPATQRGAPATGGGQYWLILSLTRLRMIASAQRR